VVGATSNEDFLVWLRSCSSCRHWRPILIGL